MAACSGCELLPGPLPTRGLLYLWPPLGHTRSKIQAALVAAGVSVELDVAECLRIPVSPPVWPALQQLAADELSGVEQRECKYLVLPTDDRPTLGDLGRVNSLPHLIGHVTGRWLVELLAERRLKTLFQPIVDAQDCQRVFAHECLLRGVDPAGEVIGAKQLYDAARDANLLYHLDRSARLQHIAAADRHQLQTAIFINFNPTSIYDPEFCLRSTVAAIEATGLRPEKFVFEVVESDRVSDPERLPKILDYYRAAGFRVALDDLGAGYGSLNLLSQLRPDFVKLDMELIRGIDCDPYKGQVVGKLIEAAHGLGVEVIAEGIETAGEWNWAAIHGADYVQGYLFGRPSEIPAAEQAAVQAVHPHADLCR